MQNEIREQPTFAIASVVVVVATMLLVTVEISMTATENVFAYEKNQANAQANACGNGQVPTNTGCENVGSQIQGDGNNCTSNSLVADQVFPEERNDGEIQAFQIPGESEGGVMRNPFGPGDPFAPLPPC